MSEPRRALPPGLYIHVPFCLSKCPYCDFYSLTGADGETMDAYVQAVCRTLAEAAARGFSGADTLYIGGGTPSLLGGKRLYTLLSAARPLLTDGAEITLEANPADDLKGTLTAFAAAGGNRLSMGMQTADKTELTALGRRHTPQDLYRAMADAAAAGIGNISLDMMLGIAGQTAQSVGRSAETCRQLGAAHVSAYLLKLEPNTPYYTAPPALPGEEETAELYLAACDALERAGYRQYEISNFAREGRQSRHNRKYWEGAPYLGIGPAAHSFIGGRRFAYPRSLAAFLRGEPPLPEDPDDRLLPDGSPEEFALLRLRLTEGLTESAFAAQFDRAIPREWRERAAALPPQLVTADGEGIRLTREGFLLSNTLIGRILLP